MKNPNKLEEIIKGFDHEKRITLLYTISKVPNRSIAELSEIINSSLANTSAHIEKMYQAGLVTKKTDGNFVRVSISALGKQILSFLQDL